MNEMMNSRLLLCLVSALLLLTTAAAEDAISMDGVEFHKKFADNKHLQPHDLDVFPTDLRIYLTSGLDWSGQETSGFSRLIAKRTYLLSVSRDRMGFNSRAALLFAGRRTKNLGYGSCEMGTALSTVPQNEKNRLGSLRDR